MASMPRPGVPAPERSAIGPADDFPPVLTTAMAAELLQVHVEYLRRMVREDRIPCHRFPGGRGAAVPARRVARVARGAAGRRPAPRRVGERVAGRRVPRRCSPSGSSPPVRRRRRSSSRRATATRTGATRRLVINYMIHDLTPNAVHDLHHLRPRLRARETAPDGQAITPARPIWIDVQNGKRVPGVRRAEGQRHRRPVNVPRRRPHRAARRTRGHGADRRRAGHDVRPSPSRWSVRHVLGDARRPDRERVFTSKANYYEPAGAVSWDVSMTRDARRLAGRGEGGRHAQPVDDLRHVAARRGTSRWGSASCGCTTGPAGRTRSPRRSTRPVCSPTVTCRRTTTTATPRPRWPIPARPARGRSPRNIPIGSFEYGAGDLGAKGKIPTVEEGQSITFDNLDAQRPARLALHHRVQGAVHRVDRHRVPARRRDGAVRLRAARQRGAADHRRRDVEHAERSGSRDLHLLLSRAPVHARRVPGAATERVGRVEVDIHDRSHIYRRRLTTRRRCRGSSR